MDNDLCSNISEYKEYIDNYIYYDFSSVYGRFNENAYLDILKLKYSNLIYLRIPAKYYSISNDAKDNDIKFMLNNTNNMKILVLLYANDDIDEVYYRNLSVNSNIIFKRIIHKWEEGSPYSVQ